MLRGMGWRGTRGEGMAWDECIGGVEVQGGEAYHNALYLGLGCSSST